MGTKMKSIVGQRFGKLTAIEFVEMRGNHHAYYRFKCDCGNEKVIPARSVKVGNSSSCGCISKIPDPVGKIFGSLHVLSIVGKHKAMRVIARCECGSENEYEYQALKRGLTKTCGCRKKKYVDEKCFEEVNGDSLYWAGFIAADGCVHKDNIKIAIMKPDADHVKKFIEFTKSDHQLCIYDKTNKAAVSFYSPKIAEDLLKFGITPRKSLTYCPTEICVNSRDFWRGMVDGDGSLFAPGYKKYKHSQIRLYGSIGSVSAFKKYIEDNICETKSSIHKHYSIFRFSISGVVADKVIAHLYGGNPTYALNRKYDSAKIAMDVH